MPAKTAPAPTVLEFPKNGTEDVFLGEIGQKQSLRPVYGEFTESLRPDLPNKLAAILEQIDEQEAAEAEKAIHLAQEIMCNLDVAKQIRVAIREGDTSADYTRYTQGIDALLNSFSVGSPIQTVQLIDETSKQNENLSIRFLTDKIKPLFEQQGLWLNRTGNTFRWATIEELEAQLLALKPAIDLQSDGKQDATTRQERVSRLLKTCNRPILFLRRKKLQKAIKKAKADPFAKVQGDEIIYHPQPFQGEMTEPEKKLIRDLAKAEAREALEGKLAKLNDKEFQRQLRTEEKAAMQKIAAMQAEAQAATAELIARRQVRNAKLIGYAPVLSIITVFGLVAFLINHAQTGPLMDAGSPTYTRIEQAGMSAPQLPQQQLEDIDAALARLDEEQRALEAQNTPN